MCLLPVAGVACRPVAMAGCVPLRLRLVAPAPGRGSWLHRASISNARGARAACLSLLPSLRASCWMLGFLARFEKRLTRSFYITTHTRSQLADIDIRSISSSSYPALALALALS